MSMSLQHYGNISRTGGLALKGTAVNVIIHDRNMSKTGLSVLFCSTLANSGNSGIMLFYICQYYYI